MQNYNKFKNVISISDYSRVRKYRQIVNSVLSATAIGTMKLNDKLPSVNELSVDFNISRDTVVRAYAFLKENNIIDSIPGKGYYIKSVTHGGNTRVFLLFDEMNSHNIKIYDAFSEGIGENALIDFYVYQNNFDQLKEHILYSSIKEYTHYVIVANFNKEGDEFMDFIKDKVPVEKLIVLNKSIYGLSSQFTSVYQDFESEFFFSIGRVELSFEKV